MALSAGNIAYWSDVANLYNRIVADRSRWGTGNNPTASSAGSTMTASQINTMRSALKSVADNVAFLSGFRSTINNTATVSAGTLISPGFINTLRGVVNETRYACAFNSSWGSGYNSFTAGNVNFETGKSQWDNGYGDVWGFSSGGGFFGHGGSQSFGFTTNYGHSSCAANCSAFFTCGPHYAAGFCTSYFTGNA